MKMNAKKTTVLVVILAALAGVISFVIWFSNHGFSAREKPSWIETALARQARGIATPAGAKEMKNPHPVQEEVRPKAGDHSAKTCPACHGPPDRGEPLSAPNLYRKVPNLTQANPNKLPAGRL